MTTNRTLSWFPGHMRKAQLALEKLLPKLNLIIEVRDARLPEYSGNVWWKKVPSKVSRILVLNKCDLADPQACKNWQHYFTAQGIQTLLIETKTQQGINQLKAVLRHLNQEQTQRYEHRQMRAPPLKAVVAGMPNVGKSTLINRLIHKKSAAIAPQPGVTRHVKWIVLAENLWLMDSPGMMLPAVHSTQMAQMLGWIAAFPDVRMGVNTLAESLVSHFQSAAPQALFTRYGEIPADLSNEAILAHLCHAKGWLLKGNEPDMNRACAEVLQAFRLGKFGRHTLQQPRTVRKPAED